MPLIKHVTLTANTVSTVDFTSVHRLGAVVRVTHKGNVANDVFFRGDGVDPALSGDDCQTILGGSSPSWETASLLRAHDSATGVDGVAVLKLISDGPVKVEVEIL